MQELRKVEKTLEVANRDLWNDRGLSLLSPRTVALQYVSQAVLDMRHELTICKPTVGDRVRSNGVVPHCQITNG